MAGISFTHRGLLVIVLDMDSVDRIVRNDPFVYDGRLVPVPVAITLPLQIMVCYAGPDEQEKIHSMTSTPEELFKYLTRGWRNLPVDGKAGDRYKTL